MSYKDENYNKVAKLPINHFLTANNKLWGKITVGYELSKFKSELKMKVGWNTCQRKLGEMKSVKEIFYKKFIWKFPNTIAF